MREGEEQDMDTEKELRCVRLVRRDHEDGTATLEITSAVTRMGYGDDFGLDAVFESLAMLAAQSPILDGDGVFYSSDTVGPIPGDLADAVAPLLVPLARAHMRAAPVVRAS